ncbi:hypothetical protein [Streptomyces sp. 184]|uniref:hypothetical protein n=1 Tax=Streptomyces sp. 184 TaxID=1827526 RepID=UPI003892556A
MEDGSTEETKSVRHESARQVDRADSATGESRVFQASRDVLLHIGVAMTAAPFLQAVAAHFGNKLAGSIDESTRRAARRFLRREHRRLEDVAPTSRRAIDLTTEDGWALTIDVCIPAEALGQLLALQDVPSPVFDPIPPPRLVWRESV